MSLKSKALKGVFWTISQQVGLQVVNVVVQILLARILLPEDFGLIAMLTIFISLGNILIDGGLTSSLIRKNDANDKDYSTVFFINILISVFIYAILFFCAPLISDFYNEGILTAIIRVYTISIIIRAFMAVQVTVLTKEMKFKKQMIIEIPSVVLSGVLGVMLALMGYGVWSIVWMKLLQYSIITVTYWVKSNWTPTLAIDKESVKFHFNFGYKLTLVNVINIFYQNVYAVIIGRYFPTAQLGYYNQADTLRKLPVGQINIALDKVTYPMFSSIQDDDGKLKRIYKKVMQQVFFWVAPGMISLCIVAEPLFEIVLTEKWLPAVPYFQVLCFAAIIYPLTIYNLNILKVKGRSDLILRISLIKYAVMMIGVVLMIPLGVMALVFFQAVASLISFFINTIYSGKMISYSLQEQLKDLTPTIVLSFGIGGGLWLINVYFLIDFNQWIKLIFSMFIYFGFYLSVGYLIRIKPLFEFKEIIYSFKRKMLVK